LSRVPDPRTSCRGSQLAAEDAETHVSRRLRTLFSCRERKPLEFRSLTEETSRSQRASRGAHRGARDESSHSRPISHDASGEGGFIARHLGTRRGRSDTHQLAALFGQFTLVEPWAICCRARLQRRRSYVPRARPPCITFWMADGCTAGEFKRRHERRLPARCRALPLNPAVSPEGPNGGNWLQRSVDRRPSSGRPS